MNLWLPTSDWLPFVCENKPHYQPPHLLEQKRVLEDRAGLLGSDGHPGLANTWTLSVKFSHERKESDEWISGSSLEPDFSLTLTTCH